jgi:hypothetical protein
MASTHDLSIDNISDLDPTDLSARHRAIFEAGVRGAADGEAEVPTEDELEVPAEAEAEAPPVEGEASEAPEGEAPEAPEATSTVLRELPADMTSAPIEDLEVLHAELGSSRDALREGARSANDVASIREATNRRNAIAAEIQRRIDEDAAVAAELEGLDDELAAETPLPAMASMTPAKPTAAQIAAARGSQATSAQNPPVPAPTRAKRPVALMAAMGGDRTTPGDEIDLLDLGSMLDRTKKTGQRVVVASLQSYEEMGGDLPEPLSNKNGAIRNTELMVEAQQAWRAREGIEGDARVAAICDPLDQLRQIPDGFSTAEPVRDVFPSRPMGRLGWTFIRSVELDLVMDATTVWDEDDQALVDVDDSSTWKPCVDIECPTPVDARAEAVTACVRYDITTEMSSPEHIANVMNALGAARARRKEARILQRIDQLSHAYTYAGAGYGAVPTLIAALNTALAQATYANRIDPGNYTAILDVATAALLGIDLAGRAYDDADVTDAVGYVRSRVEGLRDIVVSLDASASGTQPSLPFTALNPVGTPAQPLLGLDGVHRVRLVDPSAGLYAETGALNVGTQRGPAELRQNKTQYFAEEFILLEKNGPEPWFSIDVVLCADGSRAGLVEPAGCIS